MNMMLRRSLLVSYPEWLCSYYTATSRLALFRICFALHGLLIHLPAFEWVSSLPQAFFRPLTFSVGAFFVDLPPAFVLLAFSTTLVAAYTALLFGYYTRIASLTAAISMVAGLTFCYSLGKANHNLVFHLLTLILLAFSPWGRALSLDAQRYRPTETERFDWSNAWPVALLALLIGFGYLSAGIPKAMSWLDGDLTTQGARRWLLTGFATIGRDKFLVEQAVRIDSVLLWEFIDWAAVLFECGVFVCAVLGLRFFRWSLVLALAFHAINLFVLNIDFTGLVIVYSIFLVPPYTPRIEAVASAIASRLMTKRALAVALVCFVGAHLAVRSGDGILPFESGLLSSAASSYPRLYDIFALGHVLAAVVLVAWWVRHWTLHGAPAEVAPTAEPFAASRS